MRMPNLAFNAWLRFDVLRRLLADLDGTSFLEVGCGKGALGAWLSGRYDYVGYEPDFTSYQDAHRVIGDKGRVVNAYLPSNPDGAYDLVGAFEVLEHIKDDRAALRSWIEWVRPGGHLLLSVPAHPRQFGAGDWKAGHFRRYEKRQLENLLRESGLQNPNIFVYGFPLGYALQSVRNLIASRGPDQDVSIQERTLASGRWLQPRESLKVLPFLLTWPSRVMQRAFVQTDIGTGFVVSARRSL